MPELPEVETIRKGLSQLIIGYRIESVNILNLNSFQSDKTTINNFLLNQTITRVRRRAKLLMVDLSSGYSLLIHLKMTGQVVFIDLNNRFAAGHPSDSLINKLPDKSTRVEIKLNNSGIIFFNDQRKFGWIKLMPTIILNDLNYFKKYGPEPLSLKFSADQFKVNLLKHSKAKIKAVLLDQTVIAGIGNIYADESLFLSKIHPESLVESLTDKDIDALTEAIKKILKLSIDKGGSTDKNYINAEGKKGSYLQFAKVFRRQNQPCYICGNNIVKIRVAGRGTHICLQCQTLLVK